MSATAMTNWKIPQELHIEGYIFNVRTRTGSVENTLVLDCYNYEYAATSVQSIIDFLTDSPDKDKAAHIIAFAKYIKEQYTTITKYVRNIKLTIPQVKAFVSPEYKAFFELLENKHYSIRNLHFDVDDTNVSVEELLAKCYNITFDLSTAEILVHKEILNIREHIKANSMPYNMVSAMRTSLDLMVAQFKIDNPDLDSLCKKLGVSSLQLDKMSKEDKQKFVDNLVSILAVYKKV